MQSLIPRKAEVGKHATSALLPAAEVESANTFRGAYAQLRHLLRPLLKLSLLRSGQRW